MMLLVSCQDLNDVICHKQITSLCKYIAWFYDDLASWELRQFDCMITNPLFTVARVLYPVMLDLLHSLKCDWYTVLTWGQTIDWECLRRGCYAEERRSCRRLEEILRNEQHHAVSPWWTIVRIIKLMRVGWDLFVLSMGEVSSA